LEFEIWDLGFRIWDLGFRTITMFFRRTASLPALIFWCRSLRHSLGAGIAVTKTFRTLATRGPAELRDTAEQIATDLESGETLEDALEKEKDRFPPLFRDLLSVGERAGHLPEIFGELEKFYSEQLTLRRSFLQQITWPVIQFFAAVLVIALLIWILGIIAENRGGDAIQPIGMGLTGAQGAITFLVVVTLFLGGLFLSYQLATRSFRHRAAFEAFLLKLPAIGPCVQAFALSRFCIGMRLTHETGMPVAKALRLTLRATGNAAFTAYEEPLVAAVKGGEEFTEALRRCPHFPEEFVETMAVGEVSGQISEVMERQAEYWREEASRKLKALTQGAAWAVWLSVAIMIIIAIFKIASFYMNALNQAAG
jgi:type IV pilus assembly protein PilC